MTTPESARVAVVVGGPSSEAEVSRSSGAAVVAALEAAGVGRAVGGVSVVELDRSLVPTLSQLRPDVVFPAVHGAPGEDGTLQGCLELMALPYVGSRVAASAAAMHKALAKALFQRAGVPVTDDHLHQVGAAVDARALLMDLGGRVVVKPCSQGSALGVRFADDPDTLGQWLAAAETDLLVERRIDGREVTVGILDTHGARPRALPVIEITTPAGSWYDYEHRYTRGLSGHLVPAPVADTTARALSEAALHAHRVLGCRDLSRADFILAPDDEFVLLEVNTLPGMTETSLFPDAAAHAGLDFPALCLALVESALSRGAN